MMQATEVGTSPRFALSGMAGFITLAIGQLLSGLGSEVASFAVGVWLFTKTGSASQYSFLMFLVMLPSAVMGLFGGYIADRFDRRLVLIMSDSLIAVLAVVLWLLALAGVIQVWEVFLIVGLRSIIGACQGPAFYALSAGLITDKQLDRANGLYGAGTGL